MPLINENYIKNEVTVLDGQFSGKAFASNHVWLDGSTQSIDVPLDVTLGTEKIEGFYSCSSSDAVYTHTGYTNGLDLNVTTVSTDNKEIIWHQNSTPTIFKTGEEIVVSFNANIISGTAVIRRMLADAYYTINYTITQGYNEFKFIPNVDSINKLYLSIFFESNALFNIEISDLSEKVVETVNTKTVLYYSANDKKYKAVGDGTSDYENLLDNGDFSSGLDSWVFEANGNSIDVSTGEAVITIESTSVDRPILSQKIRLTPNTEYTIKGDFAQSISTGYVNLSTAPLSYGNIFTKTNIIGSVELSYSNAAYTELYLCRSRTVSVGNTVSMDNAFIGRVLPTSSTYTINESCSQILLLNQLITQSELGYLNANLDSLQDLWTGRKLHSELSFIKSDFKSYFPCSEGLLSGAYLQDVTKPLVNQLTNEFGNFDTNTEGANGFSANTIYDDAKKQLVVTTTADTGVVYACIKPQSNGSGAIWDSDKLYLIATTAKTEVVGTNTVSTTNGPLNPRISLTDKFVKYAAIGRVLTGTNFYFDYHFVDPININDTITVDSYEIYEVTGYIEIQNYTEACRTTLANTNYGATDLFYPKDASGRLGGTFLTNQICFDSGNNLAINFRPNLSNMTIVEVIDGDLEDLEASGVSLGTKSNRIEYRVLVIDSVNGNRYKIDDVTQGYVPTLPDPTIRMVQSGTALIGHPDTDVKESSGFYVWAGVKADAILTDEYENWAPTSL